MLTINSSILGELHKLSSDESVIFLFGIPSIGLFLARNNENIDWDGHHWIAFPLDVGLINVNSEGKLPELVVRCHDVNGLVESYVLEYGGFMGLIAEVHAINSGYLEDEGSIFSFEFEVKAPHCEADLVQIHLGVENPFSQRYPAMYLHGNLCQYTDPDGFRGVRCGYTGAQITCDRTFATCITYGNQARFGGQPGLIGTVHDDIS